MVMPQPGWTGPDYSPLIARLWPDGTLHVAHMSTAISGVTHFCLRQDSKDSKPTLEITVAVDPADKDKTLRLMEEIKKIPIKTELKIEAIR